MPKGFEDIFLRKAAPEYIKCAVETDAPDNTIIDAIIEGELTADVMKARQR